MKELGSIQIEWNERGELSHRFSSTYSADDYQLQDGLAMSTAMLVASQLGVLPPRHSLELTDQLLGYLSTGHHIVETIGYPLAGARIDLHRKPDTIVHTFYPKILEGGTMEVEEAIRRLLNNYVKYVIDQVVDELSDYLRTMLLVSIDLYLQTLTRVANETPGISPNEGNTTIQLEMLGFSQVVAPKWGTSFPKGGFQSTLRDIRMAQDDAKRLVLGSVD